MGNSVKNEIKLKPCPFCGGKAAKITRALGLEYTAYISCVKCGAGIDGEPNYNKLKAEISASDAWNSRAYEEE